MSKHTCLWAQVGGPRLRLLMEAWGQPAEQAPPPQMPEGHALGRYYLDCKTCRRHLRSTAEGWEDLTRNWPDPEGARLIREALQRDHGHIDLNRGHDRPGHGGAPPLAPAGATVDDALERLTKRRASDISMEVLEWLWPGRAPLGAVTMLDGDPGVGKSTFSEANLPAYITRGWHFPDGAKNILGPRNVELLTSEDNPSNTIVPRLVAAGADLDRVHFLEGPGDEYGNPTPIELPRDLQLVEAAIGEDRPALIVISPLEAFLEGETNNFKGQSMLRVMSALRHLAERHRLSIIAIRWLRKSEKAYKAIYEGQGNVAIIGNARAGWLMGKDPSGEEGLYVFAQSKNNLAPAAQCRSWNYRIGQQSIAADGKRIDIGCIEWQGPASASADDLTGEPAKKPGPAPDKRQQAMEFILDLLADGAVDSREVKKKAEEAGIAPATLQRASADLDGAVKKVVLRDKKTKEIKRWLWKLVDQDVET